MLQFSEHAATRGAASAQPVRNRILQSLSPQVFERLQPHLQLVKFKKRESIHRENAPSRGVFFFEEGLIARTAQTSDEPPIEIAVEGRSGVAGLSLALGSSLALNQTTAVIAGSALKIEKRIFQEISGELPELQAMLLRHAHSLGLQISYLSLCNSRHIVENRVPRWLLLACEMLETDNLSVTQETIAGLLGVRRPGVTEALKRLEEDGLIAKSRGSIRVLDADELATRSCLCHRLIRDSQIRFRGPAHLHVFHPQQKPE